MKYIKFNSRKFPFYVSLALASFLSLICLILELTTPRIPLLGFHGIIGSETPVPKFENLEMDYPQQNLESFIEYLVTHNYWFISTQELYDYFLTRAKPIPANHFKQKPIMLSFDDGYKTVYTHLMPFLENIEQKYNQKVKVVLFVNPGTLAKPTSKASTHLKCQDLREGLTKGFYDIQSHGLNHKNLTKITSQELIDELSKAQTELRRCTEGLDPQKQVASHLAYPFGGYNQRVEYYASKYYLSSYLYNSKILKYFWLRNYYEIPRLTVNRTKPTKRLIKMAESSYLIKKS